MFFDSGVEAAICFTDVSTFTSRTGEFVHYRALVYLAGVLSLFERNEQPRTQGIYSWGAKYPGMAWSRDPRILRKMAYCLLGSGE